MGGISPGGGIGGIMPGSGGIPGRPNGGGIPIGGKPGGRGGMPNGGGGRTGVTGVGPGLPDLNAAVVWSISFCAWSSIHFW